MRDPTRRKGALRGWHLLIAAILLACPASGQDLFEHEVTTPRPYLRINGLEYRNYTWQNIQNYPTHFFPYTDTARTFFDPMGNFLSNGYDVYTTNP